MLGIAFVVAVAIGLWYVARRSRHPRAIGAFRNRPTKTPPPTEFGETDTDEEGKKQ